MPRLLAVHMRRGHFERHCAGLERDSVGWQGVNEAEGLMDRWVFLPFYVFISCFIVSAVTLSSSFARHPALLVLLVFFFSHPVLFFFAFLAARHSSTPSTYFSIPLTCRSFQLPLSPISSPPFYFWMTEEPEKIVAKGWRHISDEFG
ncbi:hypothetical protein JB92DRAFT_987475 [Gautieria morchelliformis]|nr:hypothetical protein JB92DRAFT_987475 [Gautieria morchelliformis]